ncbi:ninjurin-2-like isoform X1 [Haliotis rufescens]|uniref:ninjurin-2-like isoform X1 n=1 Tax=Haliotis rufescens TaxID=6454 RepID=UPI00201F502A|nr:ninjurin-2-like isoform X1 [Haliotis rufescens]
MICNRLRRLSSLYYRSMANEKTEMVERSNPRTKDGKELLATSSYVTKKTAAQGMLDIALLMANASQLNSLFRVPSDQLTGTHYTTIVFIFLSIFLQVVAGTLIIIMGFKRMRTEKERSTAEVLNNTVVVLIFLITILNIFVNAFDINLKQSA